MTVTQIFIRLTNFDIVRQVSDTLGEDCQHQDESQGTHSHHHQVSGNQMEPTLSVV